MKSSKDYLYDYSKGQPNWLKYLINEVILQNGVINDEVINKTYSILLTNNEIDLSKTENINTEEEKKTFYIEYLTHISGVNALKENQSIKFNKEITILFGTNGSGKSGYFKILNEISGGNEEKRILPNIFEVSPKNVKIKIKLDIDENEIVWNNEVRGIAPYNKMSFLDTSYVNGLLNQRVTKENLIEPMGLHLFAQLIKYIDALKEKIISSVTLYKSEKPIIDYSEFSDSVKNIFINSDFSNDNKNDIKDKFVFLKEKELLEVEQQISSLKSTNYETEIRLLNEKSEKIKMLKDDVEKRQKSIENLLIEIPKIINEYIECKNKAEDYSKKIEIINQLPLIETEEWKTFINSAKKYEDLVDNKDICIYCKNPLNSQSKKIINAYTEYLSNSIIKTKDTIEKQIKLIQSNINYNFELKIDNIIKTDYIKNNTENDLIKWCENSNKICKSLFTSLEEIDTKNIIDNEEHFNSNNLIVTFENFLLNINSQINKLKLNQTEKNELIKTKEILQKNYLENKSISQQKDIIDKWFLIEEKIAVLEEKKKSINTSSISTLSKKVHSKLLTEKLKNNFIFELNKLGYDNLKVTLIDAGASKGVANTKLVVHKNSKISEILSEGEQKAVAIAMFLAEVNMQSEKFPIVLDDPVNSLDNNVMKKLVNRIMELDNQIIIFTHNATFLSLLENSDKGHICKNMNNGCSKTKGKHIYLYSVKEESNTSKGLIISKDADKSEIYFENAKITLQNRSNDYERLASSQIRFGLERLIDEKILLNITPQRESSKNNRINWEQLDNLGNNKELLNIIHKNYDRISGGINHDGLEARETPLQEKELNDILNELQEAIISAN